LRPVNLPGQIPLRIPLKKFSLRHRTIEISVGHAHDSAGPHSAEASSFKTLGKYSLRAISVSAVDPLLSRREAEVVFAFRQSKIKN
jgi:hypothetical protein